MKIISVPLFFDAMHRLDIDENIEGDLFEIEISDNLFNEMYRQGFIHEINNICDCIIDEYEDEKITNVENIKKAREIARKYEQIEGIDRVVEAMNKAIEKETGVFFFM